MKIIRIFFVYVRNNPLDCFLILAFSIAIIKISSLYFSVNVDDGSWDKFKLENNCKLQMNEYGNKRLSWKCEDGKVYYRWMQQR